MSAVVGNLIDAAFVVIQTAAFAFETLVKETKEHFAAKITKCWRFVRVDD